MVSPQNHYEMWLYSVKVNYIKGPGVDSGGGDYPGTDVELRGRRRCSSEDEEDVRKMSYSYYYY